MPPTMPTMPQINQRANTGSSGFSFPNFFQQPGQVGGGSGYNVVPGSSRGDLKSNAPKFMEDILNQMFLPFLNQQAGIQGPIGNAFLNQIMTPGQDFSQASTAAQGVANQLFMPGGQVASQIAAARGRVAGQGFAPSGAERAENGILNQATQTVANTFAQGATDLEKERMSLLSGAYTGTTQNLMDMLQSMFSGVGNIAQLNITQKASPKGGLLGLGFGPF
jgi:hypothetical protein